MRRFASLFLAASLLAPLVASAAPATQFARRPPPPTAGAPMSETFMEEDMPTITRHAPARALVKKALAKRRAQSLAAFRAYRKRGIYPHNTVSVSTRNIWRDEDGHLCAAATMIDRSGDHQLVADVADTQPGVRLGEVTSGPLFDWILTSGLTQIEIATIQEPFMGSREPAPRNDNWRLAEDKRLRARYAMVERMLVDNRANALEQATDRLMEHPDLAWRLVGAALGVPTPT